MPFALGSIPTGPFGFEAGQGLIAHAGGGQAAATPLTNWVNEVGTVVTAGDSVLLPAAQEGALLWVINMGAASMNIFPSVGDQISILGATAILAANASIALAAGASTGLVCYIPQSKHGTILGAGIWKQVV
jgi:hypothetical protein